MAGSIQDERELTDPERTLLQWLIENGTGDTSRLIAQLAEARVVSRCGCGCPTIDLAIGTSIGTWDGPTRGRSDIVADAFGQSPEGYAVGVILHVREGRLSELEVYANGNVGPFTIPNPRSLKIA